MKTQTAKPSKLYQRTVVGLSLLGLTLTAVLGSATPASALLAGGAKIINTASVDWDGNGAPLTAAVTVTVNNVTAPPVVGTDPNDATTITTSNTITTEHSTEILTYYITNKGTGLETITLADNNATNYTNVGIGVPDAFVAVAASINLGGTVASEDVGGGVATITVPSDGTSDGTVNGITAGDFVVIGTTIYEVDTVVDDATITNAAIITLTANHTGLLAGTQIGERGSVTLSITTGTLSAPPAAGSYAAVVTATSGTDSAIGTNNVTVQKAELGIVKEVSINGGQNFGGNVNAAAGTLLTYRITVTNAGSADASVVTITDPIPAYTSYVGNAKYRLTTDALPAIDDYTTAAALTDDGLDGDGYAGDATAATYVIPSLDAAGGNDVVILYFQVRIDNPTP